MSARASSALPRVAALAALLLAPAVVAHTPASHASQGCYLAQLNGPAPPPGGPGVVGTLSHWWPTGTLACASPLVMRDFASDAAACPAPPFVGAVSGAYCGPLMQPGASAVCGWRVLASAPSTTPGMSVGWDALVPDGRIGFTEVVVVSTDAKGSISMLNPSPLPSRVIAFPTNVRWPATGTPGPADAWELSCA